MLHRAVLQHRASFIPVVPFGTLIHRFPRCFVQIALQSGNQALSHHIKRFVIITLNTSATFALCNGPAPRNTGLKFHKVCDVEQAHVCVVVVRLRGGEMSFGGEINGMKRVAWLTQRLQEVGVSGLKPLLVQQAEETAGHVDHVLDVEEQAVQVGWRRLRKRKRKSIFIHLLAVSQQN